MSTPSFLFCRDNLPDRFTILDGIDSDEEDDNELEIASALLAKLKGFRNSLFEIHQIAEQNFETPDLVRQTSNPDLSLNDRKTDLREWNKGDLRGLGNGSLLIKDQRSDFNILNSPHTPVEHKAIASEEDQKRVRKRRHKVQELVNSETHYLENLHIMQRHANTLKQKNVLADHQIRLLFPPSLLMLIKFHQMLLETLQEELAEEKWFPEKGYDECKVGRVFMHYIHYFCMYQIHTANSQESLAAFNTLSQEARFSQYLRKEEQTQSEQLLSQQKVENSIPQLLSSLASRLPKYKLILSDLVKITDPSHSDFKDLQEALVEIRSTLTKVNSCLKGREQQTSIIEVERSFVGNPEFTAPHRKFFGRFEFEKKQKKFGTWKTYSLFLFNDMIAYATLGYGRSYYCLRRKIFINSHFECTVDGHFFQLHNSNVRERPFEFRGTEEAVRTFTETLKKECLSEWDRTDMFRQVSGGDNENTQGLDDTKRAPTLRDATQMKERSLPPVNTNNTPYDSLFSEPELILLKKYQEKIQSRYSQISELVDTSAKNLEALGIPYEEAQLLIERAKAKFHRTSESRSRSRVLSFGLASMSLELLTQSERSLDGAMGSNESFNVDKELLDKENSLRV